MGVKNQIYRCYKKPGKMSKTISRREFLKLSSLSFTALAFRPIRELLPPEERSDPIGIGRVTVSKIGVYRRPSLESERIGERTRDELVSLFEEVISPHGPVRNPRWYRVVGGYAHSAYLQRVEAASTHPAATRVRSKGQLAEVTVPFAQTMRFSSEDGWQPLYRLYFGTVHWITGVDAGPDGEPWYRITDELLRVDYHAPAIYLRPIPAFELTPISPDIPPGKKRIEVSLREQTITAWEDGRVALHTQVSSGLPDPRRSASAIPTDTPRGDFFVDPKMPSKHMGDGRLTAEVGAYELVGVPWVCFFEFTTGIAFHGTYWHDNFGSPMSRGCVNLRTDEAKWLYRWTTPVARPVDWNRNGFGTRVSVV